MKTEASSEHTMQEVGGVTNIVEEAYFFAHASADSRAAPWSGGPA
jgi:hypothetical protein